MMTMRGITFWWSQLVEYQARQEEDGQSPSEEGKRRREQVKHEGQITSTPNSNPILDCETGSDES